MSFNLFCLNCCLHFWLELILLSIWFLPFTFLWKSKQKKNHCTLHPSLHHPLFLFLIHFTIDLYFPLLFLIFVTCLQNSFRMPMLTENHFTTYHSDFFFLTGLFNLFYSSLVMCPCFHFVCDYFLIFKSLKTSYGSHRCLLSGFLP